MKRFLLIMLSLVLLFALSACRKVIVTSADELTSKSWYAETLSGLKAKLSFETNTATLIITGEEEVRLSGHLAVDPERFYITSTENFRTYTFSYRVFTNRAEVSYNGAKLVFYPCETLATYDEY